MRRFVAGLVVTCTLAACSLSCGESQPERQLQLISPVATFLSAHPEFGQPTAAESLTDWARGRRQRVSFSSGRTLLFYAAGDSVKTVWEDQASGRVAVWGEPETYDAPAPVARGAEKEVPSYTVLFSVTRASGGGKLGEILVPSISRTAPAAEREALARRIATQESLAEVTIYSTEEAYKANGSESFSKAHPGALRSGFIGSLKDGVFVPGETVFP